MWKNVKCNCGSYYRVIIDSQECLVDKIIYDELNQSGKWHEYCACARP